MDEGARLATRAEHLLAGEGLGWDGAAPDGPLLPLLAAPGVWLGLTPTGALRCVLGLLGALLAPLVFALGLHFGLGTRGGAAAGVLTLAHPLLTAHAGGPALSAAGAAATFLLGAVLLLASTEPRARRAGAVLALLLPLVDPLATVYLPGLWVAFLAKETSARARASLSGLAVVALLLTPLPALGSWTVGWGGRTVSAVVLVLVASLLGLLPFVGRGIASLWRMPGAPAWLAGAGAHLLVLLLLPLKAGLAPAWEGLAAGSALVPLALLAGVVGVPAGRGRRSLLPALGLAGFALAGTVFALSGPVQVFLLPEGPPAAGRIHRLAQAADAATAAAGDEGWIGLDLWPDVDLTALRLADRMRGRTVGRTRDRPAADEASPRLPLLPLPDLPAGAVVGVITRFAPEILEVSTEGGSGIYLRTPTARFGPWLVLHVTRP